jgi:hypothetical protein
MMIKYCDMATMMMMTMIIIIAQSIHKCNFKRTFIMIS